MQISVGADASDLERQIDDACSLMEQHYASGVYSKIVVVRHWSRHNPTISGTIAHPSAYRWYLRRELLKLALRGAELHIKPTRPRVDLADPKLLERIDETDFDHTRKKVFLFGPERAELSIQRLEHYTGTRVENFQRYVLLTNYQMHMDAFLEAYPNAIRSIRPGVQMPTLPSDGKQRWPDVDQYWRGAVERQELDRSHRGLASRCDDHDRSLRGGPQSSGDRRLCAGLGLHAGRPIAR
ncbi:MAG: hypothetical protein R3C05_24935 [Pirellulaceae bacterium]